VFVITNQAAIGRGLTTTQSQADLHQRMLRELQAEGGSITQVYLCPHRPEDLCACRKPEPGMLLQAAADHGVDLASSFTVGDSWGDIAAGQRAGTRTVLVATEQPVDAYLASEMGRLWRPEFVARDLLEAVAIVLRELKPI